MCNFLLSGLYKCSTDPYTPFMDFMCKLCRSTVFPTLFSLHPTVLGLHFGPEWTIGIVLLAFKNSSLLSFLKMHLPCLNPRPLLPAICVGKRAVYGKERGR